MTEQKKETGSIQPSPKNTQSQDKSFSEALDAFLVNSGIGKLYWSVDEKRLSPIVLLREYHDNLGSLIQQGRGLIISGGVGVGKTTILSWLAQRAFRMGEYFGYKDGEKFVACGYSPRYKIQFCPVSRLFDMVLNREDISKHMEADFLLLDDFGREYTSDFPAAKFEDFIEYRYSNMLATCITTNLAPEQIRGMRHYSRVVDRFRDSKLYQFIVIAGKSQRGQVPQNL